MPTFAEALYTMPTERLRAMAILRKLEPQRLAMAPDKRQLVQLRVEFVQCHCLRSIPYAGVRE